MSSYKKSVQLLKSKGLDYFVCTGAEVRVQLFLSLDQSPIEAPGLNTESGEPVTCWAAFITSAEL